MSSLNNEATKMLLVEEDVLSSSGKIQDIWKLYTSNVNFQNEDNDILRVILTSLESNVINHLQLSDDELESCIASFVNMVNDACTGMNQNELSIFLLVLAHALSDYATIKSDLLDNIEINMSESVSEVSQIDELKVMSAMERYGLLDSVSLQSLLDDRNLALTTACSEIRRRWGKDSPSRDEGSDVTKNPPLSLKDFVPMVDEVYLKAREMFVWRSMVTDNFPTTVQAMQKLIAPRDDFDIRRFYQKGTYLVNLANLRILTATAQYVCSLFDLDTTTAIYTLSQMNDYINTIIKQVGQAPSLLFSQLLVTAMLMRYLIRDGSEESPDTKIAVDGLKDRLAKLVHLLDGRADSFVLDEMTLFRNPHIVDKYVAFVASVAPEEDAPAQCDNFTNGDLIAATEGLLSGLEEVQSAIMESSFSGTTLGELGLQGVLSSSVKPSVEQTPSWKNQAIAGIVVECGTFLHNELNRALLDGNLENAANVIAREIALEQEMQKAVWLGATGEANELTHGVVESIRRDISTYSALAESVSGGVAKYAQSAEKYIAELLRTDVPT